MPVKPTRSYIPSLSAETSCWTSEARRSKSAKSSSSFAEEPSRSAISNQAELLRLLELGFARYMRRVGNVEQKGWSNINECRVVMSQVLIGYEYSVPGIALPNSTTYCPYQ